MNPLDHYIHNIDQLIKQLSPSEQKHLMQTIGKTIRQNNKQRIKANLQADGSPMSSRAGNSSHLRPIRANEPIKAGETLYYLGQKIRMRTIKTAQSAAHPSRSSTQAHDAQYIWGYDQEADGIKKYRISKLEKPSSRINKLMFRKIHQYKYLKQHSTQHKSSIYFLRGLTAYIASAHQHGEGNRPERQLLGLSPQDLATIESLLHQHLIAHR